MLWNNIVSITMAKRLREAGFPQPAPSVGQIWADTEGTPFLISSVDDNTGRNYPFTCTPIVHHSLGTWYESKEDFKFFTYLPMTADLFAYLPFALWRNKTEEGYEWVAYSDQVTDAPEGFSHNTNPVEALNWLKNFFLHFIVLFELCHKDIGFVFPCQGFLCTIFINTKKGVDFATPFHIKTYFP